MSLWWDCEKHGCYKQKCIPDWGFLQGVFPRGCRPTDIDGVVELDGRFLFLEWKHTGGSLQKAQRRLFQRLTLLSPDILVVILYGDTEALTIGHFQTIYGGKCSDMEECTTDAIIERIRTWAWL